MYSAVLALTPSSSLDISSSPAFTFFSFFITGDPSGLGGGTGASFFL
jgi:hypothetical protein